jgi:hypothetical protein
MLSALTAVITVMITARTAAVLITRRFIIAPWAASLPPGGAGRHPPVG